MKVFFLRHKTFSTNITYIQNRMQWGYTIGTIFCQNVFTFRAALNIFSRNEPLF